MGSPALVPPNQRLKEVGHAHVNTFYINVALYFPLLKYMILILYYSQMDIVLVM